MQRLALIALLCLPAGLACAGTFELSDPANEMNQPPRAEDRSEPGSGPDLAENSLCTVDTASGACSCIDKVKARKLAMTQQACADRVRRSLDSHEP